MTDACTPENTATAYAARIGLWLGPLWVILVLVAPAPAGMSAAAWACVGMTLLMATWWATEAIPIPVTALLPIVLAPALGIGKLGAITAEYGDPVVFLFLGGFLLAIAMQRWNLHRRIALHVLLLVGQQPKRQVAGFMLATGFISMWVSNTATAIMMLPIAGSMLDRLGGKQEDENVSRYATALLLSIAYAASIGGIATLIGTPPNALLAGYLSDAHHIDIGFAEWMLVGVPVSAVMMVLAWWWLTRGGFQIDRRADNKQLLQAELARLGPMSKAERRVAAVFMLTALAWATRPLLNKLGISWLSDTAIAMIAGFALFLLPAASTAAARLLDWNDIKQLPWDVLLLFGGGLAMANAIQGSGLAAWIAAQLTVFGWLPTVLLIGLVVLLINFLTEVTSNTATAATFLPLIGALSVSIGIHPLLLTVPATIAASCAFMLPVATPPNAIVFATGHMKIGAMIRAGLFLNIVGSILSTLLLTALIRLVWL